MTELNRKAILAMVPGNEMDVLIQQRIFKSEYPSLEEMKSIAEKQWEDQPYCTHFLMGFDAWKEDGEFMWEYNAPKYSRDIAAAWGVVEKMSDKKFNVYVMRRSDGKHFTECKKVGGSADRLFTVFAEGPTAPEAICKAALLTTLEEESR